MQSKLRIGVLFGGRSGEHEVSLMSAESVIQALDPEKYEVVPIGISKEGRWLVGGDPLTVLRAGVERQLPPEMIPTAFLADPARPGLIHLSTDQRPSQGYRESFDVIFPVLHGPYGEDGTVQGILELANVAYVGSGVAASAVGMDKALMKEVFKSAGLPVLDYVAVKRKFLHEGGPQIEALVTDRLGFPCFVKPANLGSSVGISKVTSKGALMDALNEAARFDRRLIVEKAAVGCREIECSVLGNDEPQASVPGEIVPAGDFYDYSAKYLDDSSELIIPARISQAVRGRIQDLAVKAFLAIDGAGLARVDFFVDPETDDVFVNEINTMPGFTRISMYAKLWEASGLSYPELVDRLIDLALERHRDKNLSEISYKGRP